MGKLLDFFKSLGQPAPTPGRTPASEREELVDEDALDFFNALSGTLEIELTTPATPVGGLSNLAASAEAKLVSLTLKSGVYDRTGDEARSLTATELDQVVFRAPTIRLRGESRTVVSHDAPDGVRFTVRDLLLAVEQTEWQTRGDSEWLGGIDVHHRFFEGIEQDEEGVWEINWGS